MDDKWWKIEFEPVKSSKRMLEARRRFRKGSLLAPAWALAVFAIGYWGFGGITPATYYGVYAGLIALCWAGFPYCRQLNLHVWIGLAACMLSTNIYTWPLPLVFYEIMGRRRLRQLLDAEASAAGQAPNVRT